MSVWYDVEKKDIFIGGDEISMYLYSDENGAVYASAKISDVKEVIKENKDILGNVIKIDAETN